MIKRTIDRTNSDLKTSERSNADLDIIWKLLFIDFRLKLIMSILCRNNILKAMIISAYGICTLVIIFTVIDYERDHNNNMIMAMVHAIKTGEISYNTLVMSLPLLSLIPIIITTDIARKTYLVSS